MRPWVAFSPTIPVSAAGPRTEIATSLPMPIGERPAAIAADSPPEDPPGVRAGFHGLLVRPVRRLSVSRSKYRLNDFATSDTKTHLGGPLSILHLLLPPFPSI